MTAFHHPAPIATVGDEDAARELPGRFRAGHLPGRGRPIRRRSSTPNQAAVDTKGRLETAVLVPH